MIAILSAAEVFTRGVDAASIEFIADAWDHVVGWVARNHRKTAIAQGTVTIKCAYTPRTLHLDYEVTDAEPL